MSRTIADPGRIDELASGFCRSAVLKANEICPVTSERWSLIRLMAIFNNLADDYILTLLTENAQKGDAGAENRLFEILRKKLMERLSYKR
ncbi:hypothetical protein JW948_15530 [bacterium]|nr:hypothetical protein [bacterium]